jgi:hypothetical protein
VRPVDDKTAAQAGKEAYVELSKLTPDVDHALDLVQGQDHVALSHQYTLAKHPGDIAYRDVFDDIAENATDPLDKLRLQQLLDGDEIGALAVGIKRDLEKFPPDTADILKTLRQASPDLRAAIAISFHGQFAGEWPTGFDTSDPIAFLEDVLQGALSQSERSIAHYLLESARHDAGVRLAQNEAMAAPFQAQLDRSEAEAIMASSTADPKLAMSLITEATPEERAIVLADADFMKVLKDKLPPGELAKAEALLRNDPAALLTSEVRGALETKDAQAFIEALIGKTPAQRDAARTMLGTWLGAPASDPAAIDRAVSDFIARSLGGERLFSELMGISPTGASGMEVVGLTNPWAAGATEGAWLAAESIRWALQQDPPAIETLRAILDRPKAALELVDEQYKALSKGANLREDLLAKLSPRHQLELVTHAYDLGQPKNEAERLERLVARKEAEVDTIARIADTFSSITTNSSPLAWMDNQSKDIQQMIQSGDTAGATVALDALEKDLLGFQEAKDATARILVDLGITIGAGVLGFGPMAAVKLMAQVILSSSAAVAGGVTKAMVEKAVKGNEATLEQLLKEGGWGGILGGTGAATAFLTVAKVKDLIGFIKGEAKENPKLVEALTTQGARFADEGGKGFGSKLVDKLKGLFGGSNVGAVANVSDEHLKASLEKALLSSAGFKGLTDLEKQQLLMIAKGENQIISGPMRPALANTLMDGEFKGASAALQANELKNLLKYQWGLPHSFGPGGRQLVSRSVSVEWRQGLPSESIRFATGRQAAEVHQVEIPVIPGGPSSAVFRVYTKQAHAGGQSTYTLDEVAQVVHNLPGISQRSIKGIVLETTPDPVNPSTRALVDDDGLIHIFPSKTKDLNQLYLDLLQETGHDIQKQPWAPSMVEWQKAMADDGIDPSRYAQTTYRMSDDPFLNPRLDGIKGEDFSESLKLYYLVKGTPQEAEIKALMPNRWRILESLESRAAASSKPSSPPPGLKPGWSEKTLSMYQQKYPLAETVYPKIDAALAEIEPRFPELEGFPIGPGILRYDPSDPVATLKALGVSEKSIKIRNGEITAHVQVGNLKGEVTFTRSAPDKPFERMEVLVKDPPFARSDENARTFIRMKVDLKDGSIEGISHGTRPLATVAEDEGFWQIPKRFGDVLGTDDARTLVLNTRQGAHDILQGNGMSLSSEGEAWINSGPFRHYLSIDQEGTTQASLHVGGWRGDAWFTLEGDQIRTTNIFEFNTLKGITEVKAGAPAEAVVSEWGAFIPKDLSGRPLKGALAGPQDLVDPRTGKLMAWDEISDRLAKRKWNQTNEGGVEKFTIGGFDGRIQTVSRDPWGQVTFTVSHPAEGTWTLTGQTFKYTVSKEHAFKGELPGITRTWSDKEKPTQIAGFGNIGTTSKIPSVVQEWAGEVSEEMSKAGFHFNRGATVLGSHPELKGTPLASDLVEKKATFGSTNIQLFRNDGNATFLVEQKLPSHAVFVSKVTVWDDAGQKVGSGFVTKDAKLYWDVEP